MMDPSEPLAIFSTIRIGESQYLLDHSKPAAQIPPFDEPERYIPATLIHWHQSNPSHDKLQKIAASFRLDDVWTKDFLKGYVIQLIQVHNQTLKLTSSSSYIPKSKGCCFRHRCRFQKDVLHSPKPPPRSSGALYHPFHIWKDLSCIQTLPR